MKLDIDKNIKEQFGDSLPDIFWNSFDCVRITVFSQGSMKMFIRIRFIKKSDGVVIDFPRIYKRFFEKSVRRMVREHIKIHRPVYLDRKYYINNKGDFGNSSVLKNGTF